MRLSKTVPVLFVAFVLAISSLGACQNASKTTQSVSGDSKEDISKALSEDASSSPDEIELIDENLIEVNGSTFSIEEINTQIKDTFNCCLYFHGYHDKSSLIFMNKDIFLHKDVEYDLYFEPYDSSESSFGTRIHIIITNVEHPLSTEEKPLLYCFSVGLTEWGLLSDFSYTQPMSPDEAYVFDRDVVYLGRFIMRIDEITKPPFETMDTEWVENTKSAIRLYLDMYYGTRLAPGVYYIYVKSFFKSDRDSAIIIEHENGSIYSGKLQYVHEISGDSPARLGITLYDVDNIEFDRPYLEMIKIESALSMEYVVE